ncbi:MAG TPA: RNA-binding S4 domain-containing protein, partial [Candidatus Angelobacter sp.]|nr:RNA-binding S4 domain-containing protein [Candidatus Angelobacter sp.]
MNEDDGRRLDKWLWFARFCKSRTLASKLCAAGKVRIGGELVHKAHYLVRQGDVLTFPQGPHIRVVRVVQLGIRRGPAPEARTLYED